MRIIHLSLFSLSIECPNLLDILNFPRQFVTVSLLYFSILQFPHFLFLPFFSGQEEIRYPNGTLQISFADGSVKRIDTDGTENINFPDGTKGQLISKRHFGFFKSIKKVNEII